MDKATIGRIIRCWPDKHEPPVNPDGTTGALECAAIITGVYADKICVHYFLPDGANGACELPSLPVYTSSPERGAWWWPPRG